LWSLMLASPAYRNLQLPSFRIPGRLPCRETISMLSRTLPADHWLCPHSARPRNLLLWAQ
jgi:hypothetical protein